MNEVLNLIFWCNVGLLSDAESAKLLYFGSVIHVTLGTDYIWETGLSNKAGLHPGEWHTRLGAKTQSGKTSSSPNYGTGKKRSDFGASSKANGGNARYEGQKNGQWFQEGGRGQSANEPHSVWTYKYRLILRNTWKFRADQPEAIWYFWLD